METNCMVVRASTHSTHSTPRRHGNRGQDPPGGPTRSSLDTGPFGMDGERPGPYRRDVYCVFLSKRNEFGVLKENWKEL